MEPAGTFCHGRESLTGSLNRDALEEVFVHCTPQDLLSLRSTCRTAADVVTRSEKVWVAKLRESFGLNLKAVSASDGLFMRLARRVYEADRNGKLRFQGAFVNGGVDEDAMHYFVDNMFRPDKAPYCSNCSQNADCIALLLDGEVPRDTEFARVREYMIRRCRYAAALIMNVQIPEHGRDPEEIVDILKDWTDIQLEGFFRDLVSALQAEHALGRLLLFDIPQERVAAEEQRLLSINQWLLDRPGVMRSSMLKPPGDTNTMFDSSVVTKLTDPATKRLAGVVQEVSISRVGNLTCPVSAGAVVVGLVDHSKLQGWAPEQVMQLLQQAAADPACAALNGLQDAAQVQAASEAGLLPPIAATDQTLAGIWHEFDTSSSSSGSSSGGSSMAGKAASVASAGSGGATQPAAALEYLQQQQKQQKQQGLQGTEAQPAAASSSGMPERQVSPAGIISWRPLLWFKFHTAEEAQGFLHRHRPLVEQYGAQATVRHHGPPPARRSHVLVAASAPTPAAPLAQQQQQPGDAAVPHALLAQLQQAAMQANLQPAAPAQGPQQQAGQQQAQQPQQQAQQPQQLAQQPQAQQQVQPMLWQLAGAPAEGMPAGLQPAAAPGPPPAAVGVAAAAAGAAPVMGVPLAVPVAAAPPPAAGAAPAPPGPAPAAGPLPPQVDAHPSDSEELGAGGDDGSSDEGSSGSSSSGSSDGGADMDDDGSDGEDDSGSDIDEGAEAHGAWLAPWVQDEFGADLEQAQDVVVAGEGLPWDHMDEGSSSEEDEEGAELEAGEHFDLAAVAGAGAAGGAGGAAAAGPGGLPALPGHPVVQTSAAETLLRALTRRNTRARNRLLVRLAQPVGANIVLVKLINQENLMEQYGDPHTWPNIDCTFVGLCGRQVELPAGVGLVL